MSPRAHLCNKYLQKSLCLYYRNMSSQQKHNELTDE